MDKTKLQQSLAINLKKKKQGLTWNLSCLSSVYTEDTPEDNYPVFLNLQFKLKDTIRHLLCISSVYTEYFTWYLAFRQFTLSVSPDA